MPHRQEANHTSLGFVKTYYLSKGELSCAVNLRFS